MLISRYKLACIGTLSLLMASSQVHSADVIKVGDTSIRFGVLVDLDLHQTRFSGGDLPS